MQLLLSKLFNKQGIGLRHKKKRFNYGKYNCTTHVTSVWSFFSLGREPRTLRFLPLYTCFILWICVFRFRIMMHLINKKVTLISELIQDQQSVELIGPKKLAMVLDTYKLWHYWAQQSTTAESFIKISRTKQMIANLRSFDSGMSSPCQYQRKYTEEIKDKLDTGVWA